MPAFIGVTEAQSLPAWDITVTTTGSSQDYTIDITDGTTPAIRVDWGDGTIETFTTTGQKDHTYAAAGTYQPRINGTFASDGNIRLGSNSGNRARLKSTGVIPLIAGLLKFDHTFTSCSGLSCSIPADLFKYNPQVTANAFDYVFYDCVNLTGSIPADLFKYNTLIGSYGIRNAFCNCVSLTGSIPADLFKYNTGLAYAGCYNVFGNCSGLTGSIPADLFKYNTSITVEGFLATFSGCAGLTGAIPADLFKYNTLLGIYAFNHTFNGCTGIESAPALLFKYNTSCTSFNGVFLNCNKLQLRADLFFDTGEEATRFHDQSVDFTNAMKIGTFTGTQGTAPALWSCDFGTGTPTKTDCFTGQTSSSITNLYDIPKEWGGEAWELTVTTTDVSQDYTVDIEAGTTPNIRINWDDGTVDTYTSTGEKTHTYATAGTYRPKISGSFASDGNIRLGSNAGNRARLIGTGVIPLISGLAKFESTFENCTGLTSIPTDLFRYNPAITDYAFRRAFKACTGIVGAITTDLFRYNTATLYAAFQETFYGCTGITTIPTDLFRYNTSLTAYAFNGAFYGCSQITAIPTDLFKYNTVVSSGAFSGAFKFCSLITTIPTDLFRYNTSITYYGFSETFSTTAISAIPTDLFRYNTLVADGDFRFTFAATPITSIPANLFDYNTSILDFYSTFYNCTSLATAPALLFKYNTACLSFNRTFYVCNKLQLRADLFFDTGEEATRFLDQSVDFSYAMKIGTFTGTQGTAPALWDCNFGTGTPTKTDCFEGHSSSSITNDGDIPAEWH